jgi:hypothetical protein
MKILGVLLILLGLTLLASPLIMYRTREKVVHTGSLDITAKREKVLIVPPAVCLLTIGAGITMLVLGIRKSQ